MVRCFFPGYRPALSPGVISRQWGAKLGQPAAFSDGIRIPRTRSNKVNNPALAKGRLERGTLSGTVEYDWVGRATRAAKEAGRRACLNFETLPLYQVLYVVPSVDSASDPLCTSTIPGAVWSMAISESS